MSPSQISILTSSMLSRLTLDRNFWLSIRFYASAKQWSQRQRNDQFVKKATVDNYRARSAFKLVELNDKHRFLKKGYICIDCGASPGGWSQVASRKVFRKVKAGEERKPTDGCVVAIDLLPINPIPGVEILQKDFTHISTQNAIKKILDNRKVNVVLSDMAPSFTGNHAVDHARIMNLCESALGFAETVLRKGGTFVCKFLMGGTERDFKLLLQSKFGKVYHEKPASSRKESTEGFFVCMNYLGEKEEQAEEIEEDIDYY
ncbi:23S ribosomal RNA methyltransferase [Basidiobolus meristosporus CBS 931.73]|uniref:rRNA methyltransferase 2, mitochondrial n=1 Tax=Basidiobolus meristosporus CBS 931.73 TaxID=1314790 RepID=A0A1Y1YZ82_9FUNG|nr:23S ribosomal RNA methyltransferase [Basidiobolus meristosporus CBS 931.73]|eukprot:ORY03353.1 23S ribosomal RNA methyltransferase [Basidiobolus meristosporus CBS 931.73]